VIVVLLIFGNFKLDVFDDFRAKTIGKKSSSGSKLWWQVEQIENIRPKPSCNGDIAGHSSSFHEPERK
jgi:hypothetical protein